jgi:hypothetical protein
MYITYWCKDPGCKYYDYQCHLKEHGNESKKKSAPHMNLERILRAKINFDFKFPEIILIKN